MPDAAAIDRVLPLGGIRKKARDVRFVGTVEDAARNFGHALVRQDDEHGQIVLEMMNAETDSGCKRDPRRQRRVR
jgi:hypothetical protein